MKLRDIIDGLSGKKVTGSENPDITGITADSRKVRPGYLYIAVVGEKEDGHRYLSDALERGARVLVIQNEFESAGRAVVISVIDTRKCLPEIANRFYR